MEITEILKAESDYNAFLKTFFVRSPTHAGGLLAMDRAYFFELGAYDPGLKIWGGENYELAFKVLSFCITLTLFF